jgi:rhamnogalacturonan endolyase
MIGQFKSVPVLLLAMLLGGIANGQAQHATAWIGPTSGGEWNTAANWNSGLPGVGTNATIGALDNVNYSLPMAGAGFGALTNDGVVNVNTNGFYTTGVAMLNPGGTGKLYVNSGGMVNVAGNFGFCSNSMVALSAGGVLTISGSLWIGCGPTSGASGATPGSYGVMTNSGGQLTAASTSLNPGNGSVSSGSALLVITGGANNLGTVAIKRSSGTAAFNTLGTEGLVIHGGTVTMTNLNVGGAGGNSYLTAWIDGGIVTNVGNVSLNQVTSGRGSRLLQTGGLFVVPDPGIINPNGTVAGALHFYSVTGGTNIVGGLYFGNSNASPGTMSFTNSAVIYVGSQGIASNGAVALTLALNDGGRFGATTDWTGSAAMNLTSGTFSFSPVDLAGHGHTITLNGVLSGGGSLLVTNGGVLVLDGANTYAGGTTVGGGSLVLGNASGLPLGSSLTLGGSGSAGIMDLAGFSPQLSGLTTAGSPASQLITNSSPASASTLVFSNSVVSSTYGGVIAGGSQPIALNLLGGHLTLSGQNNYAGSLFVNSGTLALSGAGSVFTGPAIVLNNSSAVLDLTGMNNLTLGAGQSLSGYGTVTGNVAAANCQLTPGTNGGGGTLTLSGNLTLGGGVTNQFDLLFDPAAAGNDQIIVSGALNLTGLNTVRINPLNGTLSAGTYHLIVSGSVGSGGAGNFQILTAPGSGLQAAISVTATGVDLVVTQSSERIVWLGDGAANAWNLVSTNWLDAGLPVVFTNGNFVVFDDTSTNRLINLVGALPPALVTVAAAADYTFAGAGKITGTVTFTKTNSGALTLLTTNDYNGVTTIAQGIVQVGNGVAAGTLGSGLVVDNDRLWLNQPTSSTWSNVISGTGSLTQAGAGTLTLAGANTYSGGTIISAGALQIGSGGGLGNGSVADGTALIFNNAGSNWVTNTISGSGTLTVLGGGTVVLGGNNSYGGGTVVSNGTLLVNNQAGSGTGSGSVTVFSGGALAGTGTVAGSVTLHAGSSFSPGNPSGTLTLGKDLTVEAGAMLNFALGTNLDQAAVTGNLTLNGMLNITNAGGFGNGTYPLFTYGGSLSGTPVLGVTPSLGKVYSLSTNVPGQVNLLVTNLPGVGPGPAVTVTDNGSTVTLGNGIVAIVIAKSDAHISTMNYQGTNLLAGGSSGGEFYWSWNQPNYQNPVVTQYELVQDPAGNGGTVAEVDLFSPWSGSTNTAALDVDIHYFLIQGASGFYASAILSHPASYPDNPGGEFRMVGYLNPTFSWLSVDAQRNRLMPLASTASVAVSGAPKEFQLWTAGIQQGQYDCKYGYSADLCDESAWGWSSPANNLGVWMTAPSREYYNGGPMKRELMCHDDEGGVGPVLLQMVNGMHYTMGSDTDIKAGESFSKTFGPWLVYANSVPAGTTNAPAALFADAQARGLAEQSLWPYAWWTNAAYVPASGRGTVTGTIKIADSGNPQASPAGLWVGVAQAPLSSETNADFQYWEKNLQFWVKSDANGNFSLPKVVAGTNYTLFAFGPGAAGTFQSQPLTGSSFTALNLPASPFSVTVVAGATNALGTVTWTPTRVGPTVWEIGVPDRSAHEFLHGTGTETNGWWYGDIGPSPTQPSPNWMRSFDFASDFPTGLVYTVGQSQWATGWNFAHTALGTNASTTETWKVLFNLPQAPGSGAAASLYLGFAADYQGPVKVVVNGNTLTSGITPPSGSDDTMIRLGIHGVFSDVRLSVPASDLQSGQNEMDFTMNSTGSTERSAMYDYLRLELSSYLPPPPVGLTATVSNLQVALGWTAISGATSYTVRRASSLNGAYMILATNVFAPVVGSGITNATWLDIAALVGTNYYVVASVNPNGSTNSSPVSAVVSISVRPQINQVYVGHGNLVFSGTGGTASQRYYLMTSTNLALPRAQWTPIATNYFDAAGDFAITNAINPNAAQSFYLLQLP